MIEGKVSVQRDYSQRAFAPRPRLNIQRTNSKALHQWNRESLAPGAPGYEYKRVQKSLVQKMVLTSWGWCDWNTQTFCPKVLPGTRITSFPSLLFLNIEKMRVSRMGTPNHYGQHVGGRVVHLHWCPWSLGCICDPGHVLREKQERYLMTIMAMWRPVNDDLGVSTQIKVVNRSNGFLAKRGEFQGSPILRHPHLWTKWWSFTTFLHNWPRKPPKHSWHHFHGLIASHLSPSLPSRNKGGCCVCMSVYVALEQVSWKGPSL